TSARDLAQAAARFDVQCGHRLAFSGIIAAHPEHSFVGAGAGFGNRRFTCWTSRKTANATMRKLMIALRNTPWLSVGAPAAFAGASVGNDGPDRLMKRSLKSTPPRSRPIGGIRMSLTSEVTMVPNA